LSNDIGMWGGSHAHKAIVLWLVTGRAGLFSVILNGFLGLPKFFAVQTAL
jgi:hypothetical protein